ncbi:MAG: transglutaminase domain-containing protein [Bacteroidetes bacterium]|nr:transglutaminase domain-containing protein [Bacteroidota bacterium]
MVIKTRLLRLVFLYLGKMFGVRILRGILFICWLLFLLPETSIGQDFKSRHTASETGFPHENIVIDDRTIDIQFKRQKHGKEPVSLLHHEIVYRNLTSESVTEVINIALDGHSSLEKVRVGHRSINRKDVSIHPYSDGSLIHSDVRVAEIPVYIKPNAKKRRLSYTVRVSDVRYLPPIYFTQSRSVANTVCTISFPDWISIGVKTYNMDDEPSTFNERITARNTSHFQYLATDLCGERPVDHIPGPGHVYPHLLLFPRSYRDVANNDISIFRTMADLYQWYVGLISEPDKKQVKINDNILDSLIQSDISPTRKSGEITDWVRENIRYLAFEAGLAAYSPQSPAEVYTNRYGDCKGMASLVKDLCLQSGIDARLAWLGTDYLVYDYSEPGLPADNHMICVAMIGGDTLFLDATIKGASGSNYGSAIAGQEILIENGEDYILTHIPENSAGMIETRLNLELREDGFIFGDGHVSASGESAIALLNKSFDLQIMEDNLFERTGLQEASITTDFTGQQNLKNSDGGLHVSLEASSGDVAHVFRESIYLDLSRLIKPNLAHIDTSRMYNYYFDQPDRSSTSIRILVPKNYMVTSKPQDLTLSTAHAVLNVRSFLEDHILTIELGITIKSTFIQPIYFKAWNDLIARINEQFQTSVILQKESN